MQRKLLFLAYIFLCADGFAQQYPFVYYTPKEGLVNSRVRSIKQDSRGKMIFITYGGLSIYDGAHFTNYGKQDGLGNDLVNDVLEINPDSFLIATNTSTLNTLSHGKIGTYQTSDKFYPIVNRFFKTEKGDWYVAADEGLFALSGNKFERLPLFFEGVDIGFDLDRILEWKDYWLIGVWNSERKEKLILYDRRNKKVADVDTHDKVINCAIDGSGRIWMSAAGNVMLLDTAALAQGRIRTLPVPDKYKSLVQYSAFIFFDQEKNQWFYGQKGIVKISATYQRQAFNTDQGLKTNNLTDLYIDHEGIAWFATDGNGIIKVRDDNIELLERMNKGQPVGALTCQDDTVWTFTNNTVYRVYKNEITPFVLHGPRLTSVSLCVHDQQLYLMDPKKAVSVAHKDQAASYGQPKLLIDNAGKSASFGTGIIDKYGTLIQYVKENDTMFLLLVLQNNKISFQYRLSYMVDQVIIDHQNLLWVATRDNHLLSFSLHPDQPGKYLQLVKDYTKQLPEMTPRCIAADQLGNVWIGSRYHGVYRLEFNHTTLVRYTHFDTQNGLTDNFVYAVNCDSNNTAWVGTQTGLDRIFLKGGQFIIGNVSKSNNFFESIHRIVITKNNTVWALTGAGSILKIAPSASRSVLTAPHFLFTSVLVNNQAVIDSTGEFSYQQNNLSFDAAALSFLDERAITYSYLLEGSNTKTWSKPSNNSSFNFINLSPGEYTLRVKASYPEAVYPAGMINYFFTIRPPWWQSWWFKICAGLFIAVCLAYAIRFYYRRKLEKQKAYLEKKQAIEKERTRIASDMHDDLGAGLSRIKFLSETIGIKKQRQLPFEDDITKIREYSHEMIDKMGEIVWALNEKNDSLSDLLSYTRSYTVEYLSQNGVTCTIDSPDFLSPEFVSGEFRRNIFLSVKEILHNIVKHSQADQVKITIAVDKKLCVKIHDEGIGFDRLKIRPYSNGLNNIERRMKDIGGTAEFENEAGTTVKLTVPLPVY